MSLAAWTGTTLEAEIRRMLEEEVGDGDTAALDDEMDTIFGLAELQLQRDLDLEIAVSDDTSETMSAGTNLINKASDCIAVREVFIEPAGGGARTLLLPRTHSYLQIYWPNDATQGTPLYWAEYDTTRIMVAPTPDASYPAILRQTVRLTGLSSGGVSTTYLSRVYPDAMLYACLAWAEVFLFGDERVSLFDQRYINAMPAAIREQLSTTRRTYSRQRAMPMAMQSEG